jgi:NADH-quinone oxidoreductase subunit N
MTQVLVENLRAWLPELALSVGAMAAMLCGTLSRRTASVLVVTWLCLLAAGWLLWVAPQATTTEAFFGLLALDQASGVLRWMAIGIVGLVALMVSSSSDVERAWSGEYLGLLLFAGVGLMLMAEANHLLMIVLAIELVSLSSYCLVALVRDARSSEAALKYLLFGAMSSGIMLFGMSLIYGLCGELELPLIRQAISGLGHPQMNACLVAVALVLAGLAFKVSMVPFHMWTPDVYEGAPIPVTAMLSVGPKAAGLVIAFRFIEAVRPLWEAIVPTLVLLTILTMTLGNVVAVVQSNVKRLLAYSTIGQVGYLLIGLSVNTRLGLEGLLVYLVAYLFMNLGAFACVVAVCDATHDESLEAFRGLARRSPALALCCALFLLSLAGIPPLVGFIGKFLLFGSAIEADRWILAVAGVINSTIALYYYVNIIRQMYLEEPASSASLRPSLAIRLAVGVCGAATIGLGLFPGPLLALINRVSSATLL